MKFFRKLIRDKVPEAIRAEGRTPIVRTLNEEEFLAALKNKLLEEVQELRRPEADLADEIADVYEVLETLAAAYGRSAGAVKERQAAKRRERGGFRKRLFLEGVE
jgi:predicted house-cleaning noncanonical NTP pyrophosphatase (MazG superfamily)